MLNQVTKQCPYCKSELRIDTAWIGQKLECPYCNQKFILSDGSSEPDEAPSATSVQFASDERTSTTTYAGDPAVGKKSIPANTRRLSIVALSIASVSLIMSLITLVVFLTSRVPSKSPSEPKNQSEQNTQQLVMPKGCKLVPSDSMNPKFLLQTMSSKGAVFRAKVETSSYYPYRWYEESSYWSACVWFYVTDRWKSAGMNCTAYAEKNSEVGRKLVKVFEKGRDNRCLIHIKPGFKDNICGQCYEIVDIEDVSRE